MSEPKAKDTPTASDDAFIEWFSQMQTDLRMGARLLEETESLHTSRDVLSDDGYSWSLLDILRRVTKDRHDVLSQTVNPKFESLQESLEGMSQKEKFGLWMDVREKASRYSTALVTLEAITSTKGADVDFSEQASRHGPIHPDDAVKAFLSHLKARTTDDDRLHGLFSAMRQEYFSSPSYDAVFECMQSQRLSLQADHTEETFKFRVKQAALMRKSLRQLIDEKSLELDGTPETRTQIYMDVVDDYKSFKIVMLTVEEMLTEQSRAEVIKAAKSRWPSSPEEEEEALTIALDRSREDMSVTEVENLARALALSVEEHDSSGFARESAADRSGGKGKGRMI